MTIHYHGTPITPIRQLEKLAGRHFCVSFKYPEQVKRCHDLGQSILLDNGAYSYWKSGESKGDWGDYYEWTERWLDCPTTWAVIPDVIEGEESDNDRLVDEWPYGNRGAPVWHLHESLSRLLDLVCSFERVCFGSSGQYKTPGMDNWCRRVDSAFSVLQQNFKLVPWIHMLRGMSLAGSRIFPFASLDSSDVAQNHNREQNEIVSMAQKWDSLQCRIGWGKYAHQTSLLDRLEQEVTELREERSKTREKAFRLESENRRLRHQYKGEFKDRFKPSKGFEGLE